MTKTLIALLVLTAAFAAPGLAQRFAVSVGYSRMTDQADQRYSNGGSVLRAGTELNPSTTLRFGVEVGMDRLGGNRRFSQTPCVDLAVVDGVLYLGSTDGYLYAIR